MLERYEQLMCKLIMLLSLHVFYISPLELYMLHFRVGYGFMNFQEIPFSALPVQLNRS
jgi:hypothetical protein